MHGTDLTIILPPSLTHSIYIIYHHEYFIRYEGFYHHINVLSRAYHVMRGPRGDPDGDPSRTVRELQMNIQYLGVSPGILSIAFGSVVKHLYPNLDQNTVVIRPREGPGDKPKDAGDAYDLHYADHYDAERGAERAKWRFFTQPPAKRTQVRVGIVSEHEDNSSPGNCLKRVFAKLAEFTHEDAENENGGREKDFEFVFFAREGSRTVFTATVFNLSERTYNLDHDQGSLEYNRAMLAAERLDVLLYIALPTEKLTWFLSHGRVAPVQVVFGVGHPLTSGSSNIDYSVVSSSMFQSLQTITQYPPTVEFCLEWGNKCAQELARGIRDRGEACGVARRSGCAATPFDSTPPSFYSEQLVVMDSLSYFLESHLLIYEEPVVPLQLSYSSSCATVNGKLRKWGFFPNITAEQLGCIMVDHSPDAEGDVSVGPGTKTSTDSPPKRTSRSVNLYTCIQIPKKMHPSFDPVIAGVLRADPQAVIMVEYKYAAFFPRLLERANADLLLQQQQQQQQEEVTSNDNGGGGGGKDSSSTSSSSKLALFTMEELHRRILLIPRIPHLDYQQLLSLSSVFLNTFPFGAGITSSEAIATCVPVVVDASRSSVLHLGLAQVRRLGDDFAADLVVRGAVDDYIARAVLIASLDQYTLGGANGNDDTTSGAAPPVHVPLDTKERREHGTLYAYRQALCRRKDRLLGDETAAEVAAEWANFLKAVAMPYKE
jgi:hypothetical protein